MVNEVQKYRDQYLMINQCKDERVRNKKLAVLMTEMENVFNIPGTNDETYNVANPVVITLYQDISNSRFN